MSMQDTGHKLKTNDVVWLVTLFWYVAIFVCLSAVLFVFKKLFEIGPLELRRKWVVAAICSTLLPNPEWSSEYRRRVESLDGPNFIKLIQPIIYLLNQPIAKRHWTLVVIIVNDQSSGLV